MFKNIVILVLSLSLIFVGLACIYFGNEVKGLSEALFEAKIEIREFGEVVSRSNAEVAALRKAIPGYLGEAETVVSEARGIADDAGSNFLTGVIKSPFRLIKNLGSGLLGLFKEGEDELSEGDHKAINKAVKSVLASNQIGKKQSWKNKKSKRSGSVKLVVIDDQKKCRSVEITVYQKGKKERAGVIRICKNNQGDWEMVKQNE